MRVTVRIGDGRGHTDSCMTRGAIGCWTPYRHHTVAPLVARARRQMSLVTSIRRERAVMRREKEIEGERQGGGGGRRESEREREETRERIASRLRILPRSSLNSRLLWMSALLMTRKPGRRDFYVDVRGKYCIRI